MCEVPGTELHTGEAWVSAETKTTDVVTRTPTYTDTSPNELNKDTNMGMHRAVDPMETPCLGSASAPPYSHAPDRNHPVGARSDLLFWVSYWLQRGPFKWVPFDEWMRGPGMGLQTFWRPQLQA
jgi:hypothetical protein